MDIKKGLIAKVSITINVPIALVWDALINPEVIKQYMFGTEVISDWKEGSPVVWKGEWEGKAYQDRGVILKLEPRRLIQYSHFSPLSGLPDLPENYHIVQLNYQARGMKYSSRYHKIIILKNKISNIRKRIGK